MDAYRETSTRQARSPIPVHRNRSNTYDALLVRTARVGWSVPFVLVLSWTFVLAGCDDEGANQRPSSEPERATPTVESRTSGTTDESAEDAGGQEPRLEGTGGRDARSESERQPIELLALGNSYTSAVGVSDSQRWPVVLAERLRSSGRKVEAPAIFATGGWTSRQLLDGLRQRSFPSNFDYVAVLIGTNDALSGWSPERFGANLRKIVALAARRTGDRPERVLVLTLPDYGVTPVGKRWRAEQEPDARYRGVEVYNQTIRRVADDSGARVVDIEPISDRIAETPDLLADALHPGARIHELWAGRVARSIRNSSPPDAP